MLTHSSQSDWMANDVKSILCIVEMFFFLHFIILQTYNKT